MQEPATQPAAEQRYESWFATATLDEGLAAGRDALPLFRAFLEQSRGTLTDRFEDGVSAPALIEARSWLVDQLLRRAWGTIMGCLLYTSPSPRDS